MKFKLFFYMVFFSTLAINISCSKDDDNNHNDIAGAISLNMMNEENGATKLGLSDVYIDRANNFYGKNCLVASLGKKNALENTTPMLQNLNNTAAVELKNSYQIFVREDIRNFPSGNSALSIKTNYYNVHVASFIEKDKDIVGANVKLVLTDVPAYTLPEFGSNIGELNYRGGGNHELEIDIKTSDFEYKLDDNANKSIYCVKEGNKLIVGIDNFFEEDTFGIYIRIKGSYTYVYVDVLF